MNHAIVQTRRAAARHGVRIAQGRPGGPELDVLLVLAGDGNPPRNLHTEQQDGEAVLVGVLVQTWASRQIPGHRLAMDMAMGRRVTGTTEKVKEWECWGPRGAHRVALLARNHDTDPGRALDTLMRQCGPRRALAKAREATP